MSTVGYPWIAHEGDDVGRGQGVFAAGREGRNRAGLGSAWLEQQQGRSLLL